MKRHLPFGLSMLPIKEEHGFTLVELLLVLAVIISLLSVGAGHLFKTIEKKEYRQFLQQFNLDLLYLQQLNMMNDERYYLSLERSYHRYHIREAGYGEIVLTRHYPDDWSIETNTLKFPITYSHKGTLNKPGSFKIITRENQYFITCPFGKGRCYSDSS
ncbi:competence type IV pilus minor pilin ComGD [Gracilibacillus dipsosauri]|nr:competence type IV pilus minor pilin ComGD [Gracilibacillus dipsosauri]